MSTIPPDIVGPLAQSGVQQQHASRGLEHERAQQAGAMERGSRISDQAADTIGEADGDTRVHTDAEGTGSQGRAHSDEQGEPTEEPADGGGVRCDDDGQIHLDLEA